MKRIYLVLFSLLTLATASFAGDHYYYENGQRINLTVVNEYVLVKPVAGFADWATLLESKPYLDSDFSPSTMADGFMLLRIIQGYSSEAAVSDLTNTTDIDLANNVYSYPRGGGYTYATDQLYLHFQDTVLTSQIDSLFTANELVLIDSLYGDHFIRLARISGESPADVISLGNRLYESGMFVHARAGFAMPFGTAGPSVADDYYYENGERVDVTPAQQYVVVKPGSGFTTWNSLLAGKPYLDPDFEPVPMADGFMLVGIEGGYSASTACSDLRLTQGIVFANNVYEYPGGEEELMYPTDNLYLHFKTTATDNQIDSIFAAHSLMLVDSLYGDHFIRIARSTVNTPADIISTGNRLFESGLFIQARAGLAMPFKRLSDPNDEYFDYQWYLKNDGSGGGTADADIDFDEAREYYMPTTELKIGVIDDGFEAHSDLPGSRLIGGWDYFHGDADVTPGPLEAHGMGCAGIITATQDNSEGVAGITSFNVKYVGQKIFADACPPYPLSCAATDPMIALAIDSCRIKGVKVISNSWGCYGLFGPCYSKPIYDALTRADSAGIVVTFASGNGVFFNFVSFPANHPKAIAVGATDRSDVRWDYSMYGPELDVVAPSGYTDGVGDIWTLDRPGSNGYNPSEFTCSPQDVDYDCKFGGTSAACPQVSGVATLLLLRRPDLIGNTEQIRRIIRYSSERTPFGKPPSDTARVDNYVGWGRLNAARALLSVVRGDANNSGSVNIADATYLLAYIGDGGPAPVPNVLTGDANGTGSVNISDAVYIINYVFAGGPPPPVSFNY